MKVVILAGGYGTRLAEYTDVRPKPMVEIGGHPILWHIMKIYAHYGYKDFVVALGYKSQIIKEYFLHHHALNSNFTVDLSDGNIILTDTSSMDWQVTLVDTGQDSMTGGRVKRLKPYLDNKPFQLTYGDGVADVDIESLVDFHKRNNRMVTITAVHPQTRYGELKITDDNVSEFKEKPELTQSWINGGFMVLQPEFIELIEGDQTVLEKKPLETVAQMDQLAAYKHEGFWQCMDTLRDMKYLNSLWDNQNAPWKVW